VSLPRIDLSFPHHWQAEVLRSRPLILPPRHFVYPLEAEEVERGALEVLVRPGSAPGARQKQLSEPESSPFLATCTLGFVDPSIPTGLWSCPDPQQMCAVSGGYAYVIDTAFPSRFSMLAFRPVVEVRSVPASGLLLFVGHRGVLAWAEHGQAWESEKLSDEGVVIAGVQDHILQGTGWSMMTDTETPFRLDLRTGLRIVPTR
jgi:hypothetical protein